MAVVKRKWISIMIVPEDGAGVRNWRISTRRYSMLKAGLWLVVFFLFAGFASSLALVYMYFQLRQTKLANRELIDATSKIEIIAGRLADYEKKEHKLRNILGGDLDIPAQISVEQVTRKSQVSYGSSGVGFSELENAIIREKSRLRRIPNIWPVDAWQITKEFINTDNPRVDHLGIDILSWEKSPVAASADGKVVFADMSQKLGQLIRIDHGNRWITEYGHNSILLVKYGYEVKKGQTIAVFGGADNTGSGPHLHFAMYYNNKPVNPMDYLESKLKLKLAKKE